MELIMKLHLLAARFLLCVMLLVSGCAEITTLGGLLPPKEFTGIVGKTTAADVVAAFGEPDEVQEAWYSDGVFHRILTFHFSTKNAVRYTYCDREGRCATNMYGLSVPLSFDFGQDGILQR